MTVTLLLYNLKLNFLIFSTSLNSSLITFIRTYTVNYRNALDRLCVHMNIILLIVLCLCGCRRLIPIAQIDLLSLSLTSYLQSLFVP